MSNPDNNIEYLKHCHLFAALKPEQLAPIARLVIDRRFPRGQIIFFEGDPGEALYILKRGRVKIYKQDEEGREYILHYINPGEVFAEVVLFDGGPYPATAEAVEDSEIGLIRNRDMDALLLQEPQIALTLLKIMARRLRNSQQQIMELALKDVTRRLVLVLLKLSEEHGEPTAGGIRINLPLTNQELAKLVGTTRETVNRILSDLRRQNIVVVNRQSLVINRQQLTTLL